MRRTCFVLCVCVFLLSLAGSAFAASAGAPVEGDGREYTLRVSTQMADTDPFCDGFREIAARVDERTGGKLKVVVYPSAQLVSTATLTP